jgi:hypothetical protein
LLFFSCLYLHPRYPVYPHIFCFSLPLPSPLLLMNGYPCPYLSTIRGEFLEPQPSSKPNTTSSFEVHPGYIALLRAQPFSGAENEDPHNHLREFEEVCSCLVILGIT